MTTPTDGSEDVNDFLLRIRELGERRDKEDDDRTKKLEDEILQGRKERQARRAERARSIADSPTLNPSRLSVSSLGQPSIDPPEHLEPTLQTQDPETPGGANSLQEAGALDANEKRRGSVQDSEAGSPTRTRPTLSRSRAGTLSWQQRPQSRDFGNRSPGSTSPTRSSHLRNASTASDENQLSRAQVANSLSSKDPAWFRQTADRGFGSPAFRKPEERLENHADLGPSRRLPGMSRESTVEPEREEDVREKSPSPPRTASTVGESNSSHQRSSVSSVSPAAATVSPVALSGAPKLDPPQAEAPADDPMPPSPTQRRMSPERARSTSPTKGLGGFVQSAMMKRSDSVSKRWSAHIPQGLSRSNSIISNRNSVAFPTMGTSASDLTPTTGSQEETSSFPTERPHSSHSEATAHPPETNERPTTPSYSVHDINLRSEGSPTRPRYSHARSNSSITTDSQTDGPSSPYTSRTMDPKRWSPTKASWLESALNRPEPTRTQRQPPSQPSWATHRQSRGGSIDIGRANNFKEVTPVGLMRTPPPGSHFKKPSITGPQSIFGSPIATKPKDDFPESQTHSTDNESVAAETKSAKEVAKVAPMEKSEPMEDEPVKTELTGEVREEETRSTSPLAPEPHVQEPPAKLEGPPKQTATRKSPPPALSPKPNFSRPTRDFSREPSSPKPKPQNPAMDFRANLRKREVVKDSGADAQPEFKNMFGRLKKTETRNYVAPDELKGNILRGKAALNLTGGPQKTERVDELKESLVKQKEAMKAGGGSTRRNTAGENDAPEKPPTGVPEAIAKRNNMNKTNGTRPPNIEQKLATSIDLGSTRPSLDQVPVSPSVPERSTQDESREVSPIANEPRAITTDSPLPVSPLSEQSPHLDEPREPEPIQVEPKDANIDSRPSSMSEEKPKDVLETARPWMKAKETPPPAMNSSVRGLPSARFATARTAAANPGPAAKGKLAGRINPALANILSRGPPAAPESPSKSPVAFSEDNNPASPSAPLTHITKGRARGPKRRLPKGDTAPAVTSAEDTKEVGVVSSPEVKPSQNSTPEPFLPLKSPSERHSNRSLVLDTETAQKTESSFFKKLTGVNASFQDALNSGLQQRLGRFSPLSSPSSPSESSVAGRGDQNSSPRPVSPSTKPVVPSKSTSSSQSPSTPTTKTQWAQSARYISASPSPLRTSFNENSRDLPPTPPHKNIPGVTVATSSPRNSRQASPPVPPKGSDISLDKPADHRLSRKMSAPSLVAQAAEAREVITGFFKTYPHPRDRMDIDPQLMLLDKPEDPKIRTVKRHIWEITGGGKRQELPINQEYVLYEGSMYVCVHLFEAQGSSGSEVYLWCGDDVPEAALEDAQLFARKIARENSSKLQVIRQGKEQVRFIQALGGIIITRRGSSSRHTSSALYMLCGRKHLGHMAFDEVDYSLRHLCSGFPYVISAPFGNMYLWKGKGSGPEETGAARLISMDLGLTGEFEEVEEGEEPESFYDVFAGSREASPHMSSDYWKLKPKSDHFGTRLLRVDHELGQPSRFWMRRPGSSSPVVRPNDTVQEVEPFCFKDLKERGVYVLDTFFEIYVIVGEQASQKSAEFASAVVFAHEYGILAASLQDRPFIPKSFVALGGIPERCQSAFRKWDPHALHAPCVFPLDVAIEAIRSEDRQ